MTSRLSRSGSTDTASWPGGPEVPFRPIDPWRPTGPRSASRTCGTPVTAATAPPAPQAAANNPSAAILAVAERRLMDWSVHLPDVTDGQRDQIAPAALHVRPAFKAKRETEWSAPRGANTHRPGFDSRHLSREVWDGPGSHVGRLTSARDEGEGVGAATIRTAPRPPTLGDHRTRTRMLSMVWLVSGALWSLLEMLGHSQPRDSHVLGGPHAHAEPTAPLRRHGRGVCARRTATKYRNTLTATHHPAGLGAALACSVANMVAVSGSSGRKGPYP